MGQVSRQLASFPCQECAATLLIHDQERHVKCPFCGTEGKAPKRLVDDLEHGRKLKTQFAPEIRRAVDDAVEALYVPVELPRSLLLAWGLICAGFFAWVYFDTARTPMPKHYAQGALLGFVLGVFPVGWCSQWLAATGLARAVRRADRTLSKKAMVCPSCDGPVMNPPCPGEFDCRSCRATLVGTRQLIVSKGKGRADRFLAAAKDALADETWLGAARPSRDYIAGLGVTAFIVVVSAYLALTQGGS